MWLLELDKKIFFFINKSLSTPFMDKFMSIVTDGDFWAPILAIILVVVMIKGRRKEKVFGITCLIAVAFADMFTHNVLKPYIHRIRPCFSLIGVLTPAGLPGGIFSFPSGHATNSFAAAVVIFYFYRKIGIAFIILSLTIGFSRIYVGVHYPLDVIFGFFVGAYISVIIIIMGKIFKIAAFNIVESHRKESAEA